MKKRILLLEPNYKNKYPPIGLMKISTYHRILGDKVTFHKGDLLDFVTQIFFDRTLSALKKINSKIAWKNHSVLIKQYIRTGDISTINKIRLTERSAKRVKKCLDKYHLIISKREYNKYPKFDRVYVTTLFTFYWNITIQTIQFAKRLVRANEDLLVGGVMASLLPDEIEAETGIRPFSGLLDRPGILDKELSAKNIIVDDLPLDYSILDEIEYEYPTQSAYFTFMTKGCTRKCSFCSVPKLEPTYKPKIPTLDKYQSIKDKFGEQRNLLLMDNNVLASPFFSEIIAEIKEMGFYKGAKYGEPNQLEIAIKNLKSNINDKAYLQRCFKLLHSIKKRIRGQSKEKYLKILEEYNLVSLATVEKRNLLIASKSLLPLYEKYRSKAEKLRYVDFNQGTDARYVTDEIMYLMSQIPIRPLRIAFDYIGLKDIYINAIELAVKYGIRNLSNYILYNFNDTPEDLYERLKINVDLVERHGIKIHSFPMKYIPLFGEDSKGREYVGKKWNKKFIRAIQSILNVTKGIVAPGKIFFHHAFGENIDEFRTLLYMPEEYIVYRKYFESDCGLADHWKKQFRKLMESDKAMFVKSLIEQNDFSNIQMLTYDPEVLDLMKHYTIKKEDAEILDDEFNEKQRRFKNLIRQDRFMELTLTYDYE